MLTVSYKQLVRVENTLARIFRQAKPQGAATSQVILKLAKMKKAIIPAFQEGEYAEGYKALDAKYFENGMFKGKSQDEQESNMRKFNEELETLVSGLKDVQLEYPEINFEELFGLAMADPLTIDEVDRLEPFFK